MSTAVSLRDLTTTQLVNLCQVTGASSPELPTKMMDRLLGLAGDTVVPGEPLWPSDIADDHTPVELSVAYEDTGERVVRVLGERLAAEPSGAANLAAARDMLTELASDYDLALGRFRTVEDLFLPEQPEGLFALWFSFIIARGAERPAVKAYFNPAVRGAEQGPGLVAEALDRLGLHGAWETIAKYGLRRADLDEVSFVSLDLTGSPHARVKVYITHNDASAEDAVRAAEAVRGLDTSSIPAFCARIGGGAGPFNGRPLISSYSFVGEDCATPSHYSLYIPIRDYVPDDAVARARVQDWLQQRHIEPAELDHAINAITERPLQNGRGLLAHVSLKLGPAHTGTTVYLSSEAYGVLPPQRST